MKTTTLILPALLLIAIILSGCSSTVRTTATTAGSPGVATAVPDEDETFDYTASNDDCHCKEYKVVDKMGVEYVFTAKYHVDNSVATTLVIEFKNTSAKDSLRLDPGVVKISSRNVAYQHNDKFLPLPDMRVGPGRSDRLELNGRDVQSGTDEWNKIAGEQLTVTIKGMRLGRRTLVEQTVTFVPDNPRMKKQ